MFAQTIDDIDFNNIYYRVESLGYKVMGDHAQFIFRITTVNDVQFTVCDRYSSIRAFYEALKKYLGTDQLNQRKDLPKFPGKKLFGRMDVPFLIQRQS